jgi:peptide-methionine (R)-S-oxide reductase
MQRRKFLISATSAALAGLTGLAARFADAASSDPVIAAIDPSKEMYDMKTSDAEWRKILTPEQYAVLRKHDTERAGTSPLNEEHRDGLFVCAGCNLPLYSSKTKFDSGTGWPSFYDHLPNAIGTSVDKSWFTVRTEVHCARCGGHLGHVFEDGPKPTGLRYCMNGVAMQFIPGATAPAS